MRSTYTGALSVAAALLCLGVFGTSTASADTTYDALLQSGLAWTGVGQNMVQWGQQYGVTVKVTTTGGNGDPYVDYPNPTTGWVAPADESFSGFGFTSAIFGGASSNTVGGFDGGFIATGVQDGEKLEFRDADDCEIVTANHEYVANGVLASYDVKDHPGAEQECGLDAGLTDGNRTGRWVSKSSEVASNTAASEDENFNKLMMDAGCNSYTCDAGASAESEAQNVSVQVDDPNNQPSQSSSGWANMSVNGGEWYSTLADAPQVQFTATDPSGVCDMNVNLAGSNGGTSVSSGDLLGSVNLTDAGSPIGKEFAGTQACNSTVSPTWTLPSNLTSGDYSISASAANAGQYEQANFSGAGDTNITNSNSALTIQVDNTVPTITISSFTPGANSAQITVTAGPSGLQSGKPDCTQSGWSGALTTTQDSGSQGGAGMTVWTVSVSGTGSLAGLSCSATNNDQNGQLSSGTVSIPAIAFSDTSNTAGSWNGAGSQTVYVSVPTADVLGNCYLNGTALTNQGTNNFVAVDSSSGLATVSSPGQNTLKCYALAGNIQNSASYEVWITASSPTASISFPDPAGNPDQAQVVMAGTGWVLSNSASLVNQQTGASSPVTFTEANGVYSFTVRDGVLVAGNYALKGTASAISLQVSSPQTFTIGTLSLPLRQPSKLTLYANGVAGTQLPSTPGTIATTQGSHLVLRPAIAEAERSHLARAHAVAISWGQATTLKGTLTASGSGSPITGQTINIYQQIAGQSSISQVDTATTDAQGNWSLSLSYGPSRTIYASWAGTATMRTVASSVTENSAAKVTIAAGTARAKHRFVISGQVLGGYIPSGGLQVTIYYQQVGRSKSYPLATPRANSQGKWSFQFTPPAGNQGMTFRYWAQVNATVGWPYTGGRSATITRTILAP